MYFVDRKLLEQRLLYLEGLLQEYRNHSFETFLEKLAVERIIQMVIESLLDTGNMIIDGFIMRDPGSFEDIIDILIDEKVLPVEEADHYKEVIRLRNVLVKDYLNVDYQQLIDTFEKNYASLEYFSHRVRKFLDGETSVANTFSN